MLRLISECPRCFRWREGVDGSLMIKTPICWSARTRAGVRTSTVSLAVSNLSRP
jgi:hypothetical protein